ncbi:hypothetical protein SAMN05216360_11969 [Methylobacterium phyllostachyos]|uniref:Uncharacterized protein n=1 Tax=Methylobacterium phyllostachyos TaxID=582672 RepID=A0A1H0IMI7_9HYPH|nr:hypothetical protein [Methylobacterium phyllostachyos]SDO32251.1 hypothetical protein SAMN05216360_11969 [Methylobacterium phyllostachyos]
MRLAGLCYSVLIAISLKQGSQSCPEGALDVRLLVAGTPSYDLRTGAYTDNAPTCLERTRFGPTALDIPIP